MLFSSFKMPSSRNKNTQRAIRVLERSIEKLQEINGRVEVAYHRNPDFDAVHTHFVNYDLEKSRQVNADLHIMLEDRARIFKDIVNCMKRLNVEVPIDLQCIGMKHYYCHMIVQ